MTLPNEIETVDDLLRLWDAGKSIWSVSMGGLGPGYEQTIQVAAVEMARAAKDLELPEDRRNRNEVWRKITAEAIKPIDEQLGGITGAQYEAASNLAYNWIRRGPAAVCAHPNVKDRLIQVSNFWPRVTGREDQP